MATPILEKNKKPGVCYALTDNGIELPVIDITHPAFAFHISEAELSTLIDNMQKASQIPPSVLQGVAQKSILVRGMVESAGTFTTGMMTYLNKLEPDNLGDGYANAIDRQWAASLTPLTFRWRMRDCCRLLADGLVPALSASRAPLNLLNIAGGPAMDSLNALILLQKEHPSLLAGRQIRIYVLDIDSEGPSFGKRALAALMAEAGPLHGLDAAFEWVAYDWGKPETLRELVKQLWEQEAVGAGSTEGGLFEYASDQDIVANLAALREGTPHNFLMVGPVVRDATTTDPRLKEMGNVPGRPAIRFIGLAHFNQLAMRAGWCIERQMDGPMHQVVRLVKG